MEIFCSIAESLSDVIIWDLTSDMSNPFCQFAKKKAELSVCILTPDKRGLLYEQENERNLPQNSIHLAGQVKPYSPCLLYTSYWDHIYGVKNDFGFPVLDKTKSDHFEIPLSVFNIENKSSRFDIKQFLCHLMGIASQSQNKAMLVYLFFKPKTDHVNQAEEIEKVFAELSEEIKNIFEMCIRDRDIPA